MRSSDDADYVEFVDASRLTLLAYAWLLTGDGHAAEELVQDGSSPPRPGPGPSRGWRW